MASIQTAEEMFVHELVDIYDAEHRFLEGQEKMVAQVSDSKLKQLIEHHSEETQQQIRNLEQVFKALGASAEREQCRGADGLVREAGTLLKESKPPITDSLVAGAAAKVEHYEIVSYTDLVEAARAMGRAEVAKLLEQNLKQEQKTAERLEKESPRLLRRAIAGGS
jgi:ferritin-like metal-binding protein YciE